jgi:3-dehydroquinate dehydratase / shikimate dehydrogenase
MQYKPLVFDAVYTPPVTRLLREAQECGCKTVSGQEMFVGQAAKQFKYFTGQEPPVDTMRRILSSS